MTHCECENVNVTIKGHQARHQSRRLYIYFFKICVHAFHPQRCAPNQYRQSPLGMKHRKHMELAKLPETKTRLLLPSSTCIGTGPDFPLSLHQHLKIHSACLWTARCGVQLGFVSPPAAVVSPCCVRMKYGMRLRSLLIVVCLCGMCVLTQKCTHLFKSSTV